MTVAGGHLLCVGMGFSARALARRLAEAPTQRWTITGTSRDAGRAQALPNGANGIVFDGATRSSAVSAALKTATHLVVSVAPDQVGAEPGAAADPFLRLHADDLAAAPQLRWVGYLSTIGVYGDHGGGWVDEATPPAPLSERSQRRAMAEREWLAAAENGRYRCQLFRLSGIYGPGRSPIDTLRRGVARTIIKPGQVFNRIHVDDIASAVAAAMTGVGRHTVYNVTDNEPAPPQEVVAFAADLLGLPLPPTVSLDDPSVSAMARSFYGENKRVRNLRLADLGVTLRYPTYREGLQALALAAAP